MFKALKKQRTTVGERKPGDEMPEIERGDAAGAKALVDAGAIEWTGKGGKYGPFTEVATKAAPPVSAPSDLAALRAELVEMRSALSALADEVAALKALGSAPAPSAPSPQKGGR